MADPIAADLSKTSHNLKESCLSADSHPPDGSKSDLSKKSEDDPKSDLSGKSHPMDKSKSGLVDKSATGGDPKTRSSKKNHGNNDLEADLSKKSLTIGNPKLDLKQKLFANDPKFGETMCDGKSDLSAKTRTMTDPASDLSNLLATVKKIPEQIPEGGTFQKAENFTTRLQALEVLLEDTLRLVHDGNLELVGGNGEPTGVGLAFNALYEAVMDIEQSLMEKQLRTPSPKVTKSIKKFFAQKSPIKKKSKSFGLIENLYKAQLDLTMAIPIGLKTHEEDKETDAITKIKETLDELKESLHTPEGK